MELFIVIALSAIVLLLGVCAYCLSFAVTKIPGATETLYLHTVMRIVRKLVIVGGVLFIAFVIYATLMLAALTF
jgi:hypothetical protein